MSRIHTAYGPQIQARFKEMIKITRNALSQSGVAGGAAKQIGDFFRDGAGMQPGTSTQTGSASSVITINGKTVIDQKVTF
ncbi:hypothetical protein AWB74_04908 [Caballeronia arvi]|uniref:Uncharacterized protein n=1 Tax=Caballeronia arvi TaxID=1777135 RepID=A0A158K4B5_9BURK|nr:hypothetical protein AWB74_04908 [Caballeronia arvi]